MALKSSKNKAFLHFEAVHQKLVYHRFRAISSFLAENPNSWKWPKWHLSQCWLRFCSFRKKMCIRDFWRLFNFRGPFLTSKTLFYLRIYFAFYFCLKSEKMCLRNGTKWCLRPRQKLGTARILYRWHVWPMWSIGQQLSDDWQQGNKMSTTPPSCRSRQLMIVAGHASHFICCGLLVRSMQCWQ